MADEKDTTSSTSSKPRSSGKAQGGGSNPLAEAQEKGYIGGVAPEPPDEAYRVDADHQATAEAERQALRSQRDTQRDASRGD
jgi:hypothetical protein